MKIRAGFVSNSSSSSFICEVCGEDASGWDLGLEDAEMVNCVNGHTFCEDHVIGGFDRDEDDRWDLAAEKCPICALEVLTDSDYLTYLVKLTGKVHDKALAEVKERFGSYDNFSSFLREK
jgi:hypothetical protein